MRRWMVRTFGLTCPPTLTVPKLLVMAPALLALWAWYGFRVERGPWPAPTSGG